MHVQSAHAPLASLAAHWHACKGDVPPPLVGASVTLVDDGLSSSSSKSSTRGKVFLFGGRLVTTRRMVNDMYVLDLATLHWTRHFPAALVQKGNPEVLPQPRYFHSCDLWDGKLVIFGGMGYVKGNESELCVLNEVVAFDLTTQMWDLNFGNKGGSGDGVGTDHYIPEPRYAHLSSLTSSSLVIVGGQDMANHYVEAINVFDLKQRRWIVSQALGKQRGSYRSLAVGPAWTIDDQLSVQSPNEKATAKSVSDGNVGPSLGAAAEISLLPTSKKSWTEDGQERHLPIYVYTNYNFTDVKREMEVVQFNEGTAASQDNFVSVEDRSGSMNGISLPPGLRFPMGAMLGDHLLISGTYLANTSQTFAIWALYLPKMTWSRLDVGPLLSSGSWNRGVLWPQHNQLLVFGHRDRDLVSDYNHRQTNWNHVLLLELEAWGITQPPVETFTRSSVELGLQKLTSCVLGSLSHSLPNQAAEGELDKVWLAVGGRGDFEIVCSDGMKLGCDRAVLEKRWPWFAAKMLEYRQDAKRKAARMYKDRNNGVLPDDLATLLGEEEEAGNDVDDLFSTTANLRIVMGRTDPRITPRQLFIGEPSPVILALLIFFYTQCICTSIQRHPAVVAALLLISKVYDLTDLERWAKHAAHVTLANDLSPPGADANTPTSTSPASPSSHFVAPPLERHRLAVAIYEAATMCGFEALQIRALRTVMSIAKWVQRSSIQTSKSSSAVDSNGEAVQTPTTSSLAPEAIHSTLGDTSASASASPLRTSFSTTTASPASYKRMSMGRGGLGGELMTSTDLEEVPGGVTRKLSKAERMLGVSGADLAGSSLGSNSLSRPERMPSNAEVASHSRALPPMQTSRAASQSSLPSASHPPPVLNSLRRPSAPVTANTPSAMLNVRGPSTLTEHPTSNNTSTGGRKRFSIFGRTSESAAKSTTHTGAAETQLRPDDEVRTSSEHAPSNRLLQRSGTNSDGTSSRSTGFPHPTSMEAQSQNGGGSLPPPAFSDKEMKRMERESGRGRMATLTRLKASALKSIDTGHTPSTHSPLSNDDSAQTIPSLTSSSATPTKQKNVEPGKLSVRELKALDSIWS